MAFDVGWQEIILVGAAALVAVGPRDLPKVMRAAGRCAQRVRITATNFRRAFETMDAPDAPDEPSIHPPAAAAPDEPERAEPKP